MEALVPSTVAELLARMDRDWAAFRAQAHGLPGERLGDRLGDGAWTRKQMLAHVGAWHDLTAARLARYLESGAPNEPGEHEDVLNARTARAAEGRTAGEILLGLDDSYRRLRRAVARLADDQLAAHDWFALAIVRGNSFAHYEEHLADLAP